MLKSIVKTAILSLIWKRYRALIVAGVLVLASLFFINLIHQDYLEFLKHSSERTSDQTVAFSFFIKWGAILAILIFFGFYVYLSLNKRNGLKNEMASGDSLKGESLIKSFGIQSRSEKNVTSDKGTGDDEQTNGNDRDQDDRDSHDPFERLRNKEKLRSKADLIIENHTKEK